MSDTNDTTAGAGSAGRRIGQVIAGRYRIDRLIAAGGMGQVYQGTQLNLDRPVALKFLHADFQRTDSEFTKRFVLEAATASRLSHPNVVTVHDYGESESGDLYMAMEYIEGPTLAEVIAVEGALRIERVLGIGVQITRGLREAHAKGVVHRDLKAGNIMLAKADDDADLVKILDFGLVKLNEQPGSDSFATEMGQDLTRAGALLGSPIYMSPEQVRGDDVGPASDIYALGVVMYEMATGRPPFKGATSVDTVYAHLNHEPPTFEQAAPDVAPYPDLEAVVLRCLSKDPADRFGSMADLTEVLKTVAKHMTDDSFGSGRVHVAAALENTGEWAPVPLPAPEPVVQTEAAFQDPALRDDATAATPRPTKQDLAPPTRLHLVVGVLGVAIALTALGVVLRPRLAPTPSPAAVVEPVPPPAPTVTSVRFESEPSGAVVREGRVRLGVTPFAADLKIQTGARTFDFELPGHNPSRIIAPIFGETLRLSATLTEKPPPIEVKPAPVIERKRRRVRVPKRQRAAPVPADTPVQRPENVPDYIRDNPY